MLPPMHVSAFVDILYKLLATAGAKIAFCCDKDVYRDVRPMIAQPLKMAIDELDGSVAQYAPTLIYVLEVFIQAWWLKQPAGLDKSVFWLWLRKKPKFSESYPFTMLKPVSSTRVDDILNCVSKVQTDQLKLVHETLF